MSDEAGALGGTLGASAQDHGGLGHRIIAIGLARSVGRVCRRSRLRQSGALVAGHAVREGRSFAPLPLVVRSQLAAPEADKCGVALPSHGPRLRSN